eukprot:CAMPEP_0196672610 /NCGR_PEP_ID=MMETSP1090-20130531/2469_1 /TAXON_ID=37098 /ORGANISM="Isochrysis sp, Strain CCMP1244" /LENGTH=225 /DNA_ID=CAMNT_0042010315 /DNA_START=260 /DNA_END=935 /DNA_ORIENTATION=+
MAALPGPPPPRHSPLHPPSWPPQQKRVHRAKHGTSELRDEHHNEHRPEKAFAENSLLGALRNNVSAEREALLDEASRQRYRTGCRVCHLTSVACTQVTGEQRAEQRRHEHRDDLVRSNSQTGAAEELASQLGELLFAQLAAVVVVRGAEQEIGSCSRWRSNRRLPVDVDVELQYEDVCLADVDLAVVVCVSIVEDPAHHALKTWKLHARQHLSGGSCTDAMHAHW